MYPFFRLLKISIQASRQKKLALDEIGETSFYCRPWDIDMFFEMNNGRILTLYDLGRFAVAIRCGLAKTLKRQKWGLVVAGGSVRYRRRVRVFDKVTMKTRLLGHDDRWFYIEQSMWVAGKPCSSVLLRTAVTRGGGTVPCDEVKAAMGQENWMPSIPSWAKEWINADAHREWPPNQTLRD